MKKLIATICSVFFITSQASAEVGIGITANFASVDTDGHELELSGDGEKTTASISEDTVIPEVFIEAIADNGLTFGVAYIPARDLGSKSRTDTSPTGDTETADAGTYKADAEVQGVVQFYTDVPIPFTPIYGKLGFSRASIKTMEVNPSNTTYEDKTVNGYTLGVGYRGQSIPFLGGGFYKVEATYTDFDKFSATDSNGDHEVEADTEVTSVKISLGTTF